MKNVKLTLIGGPTVLIEIGGLRLLTDPTFDLPGGEYITGPVTLKKQKGPALSIKEIGNIDAVLLSHEQHGDNLDILGRELLKSIKVVYTTPQSASNLGSNALGLATWQSASLQEPNGKKLKITATPARHGPAGIEPIAGDVTGFILQWENENEDAIYVSGDTVWYEGVAEIASKFKVGYAILNMGAAQLEAVGPIDLTMNASGAVETAKFFAKAKIIPAHYDGWAHWTEHREAIDKVFKAANLVDRLVWLEPGVTNSPYTTIF